MMHLSALVPRKTAHNYHILCWLILYSRQGLYSRSPYRPIIDAQPIAQYMDMEWQSSIRHEFIDGRVYVMDGGTIVLLST